MLTLIYMWFLKLKKKHEDYEEAIKEFHED